MEECSDMLPRIQRRGKKGLFSMRYWVPERFRSVEPRKEFFVALKTDDEGEAMRVAMDVQKRIEAELSAKLAGSAPQNGGAEYYERVRAWRWQMVSGSKNPMNWEMRNLCNASSHSNRWTVPDRTKSCKTQLWARSSGQS